MSVAEKAPLDSQNDVPIYKWPPFPAKPEGVTIIPFADFIATGLKDQDEDTAGVDQMGIPTVELEVRHDGDKKKRRRKKKGSNGEIIEEPLAWWEEFEEDAKNPRRRFEYKYDKPCTERLEQAWENFIDNRRFPPHVSIIAQALGVFLGFLKPSLKVKKAKKKADGETDNNASNGDDSDNDSDSDNGDTPDDKSEPNESETAEETGEGGAVPEPKAEEAQNGEDSGLDAETKRKLEQIERERERDERAEFQRLQTLNAFYEDIEKFIKMFLSSHAYEKGVYWNEAKLHDTPILVEAFLNFVESNSVFGPEEEKVTNRITQAKNLAKLAKQEMPHVNKIARLFPDAWGKACADIWGSNTIGGWEFGCLPGESQATASESDATTTAPITPVDQTTQDIPNDPVHGDNIIFEPTEAELLVDSIEPPSTGGQQTEWSKADGDDASVDEQPAWNSDEFKEPPPEDPANAWGNLVPSGREQLETLIGPNKLPETYVTLRAESSSRIISSVVEPAPNPPANLEGASFAEIAQYRLARLTLSPSPYSEAAPEIGACINQPIMYNPPIDESKFGWVGQHDPLANDITVFVRADAEFLETLAHWDWHGGHWSICAGSRAC